MMYIREIFLSFDTTQLTSGTDELFLRYFRILPVTFINPNPHYSCSCSWSLQHYRPDVEAVKDLQIRFRAA